MKKFLLHTVCVAALAIFAGTNAFAQPNLTPYQPSGWSDKIVVATTTNTTTESATLSATNNLYVDWAVANFGNQAVTNSEFYVDLYVDSALIYAFGITGGMPASSYTYFESYPIGLLSPGTHTVEILADATMVVPNDNRSDDSYTKTISVSAALLPAAIPYTPANGSIGQSPVPFFTWSTVTNATKYRVLIATNASDLPSSPTATNGGASVVINAVAPATNFSPTIQLNANTTYYWSLHAITSSEEDGTWSAAQSFTVSTQRSGLTIVPTFDSTITSDPQAATIEATINAAIAVYRYNFSDAVTANFTFAEMSDGLGYNDAYLNNITYTNYRAALVSHATTADDATALAHLPNTSTNPVNGSTQMQIKLPLSRALGYPSSPPAGNPDATVYLNTSIMNLSSFTTDPAKNSLFATVSHEMDEALGFGSALNGSANGEAAPTGAVQPQDLFRYDQYGNHSFTTALNATSYFSFDGTNDLVQFNQYDGGDFGDWYSYYGGNIPQVQDAYSTDGANPVLGVELRGLDAIGFTRVVATNLPPQLTAAAKAGTNFTFLLSGTVGDNYIVQVSTNLVAWSPLSTNTIPASGSITITNGIGTNLHRFFRAVYP